MNVKKHLIMLLIMVLTITSCLDVMPGMAAAPENVKVDISSYFNGDVVNYAGTYETKSALMEGSDSYDAALLTAAFPGGTGTYEGVDYRFGSFEGSANQVINISAETTITIPKGCYDSVRVAAAMGGTANGYVMKLNYQDGTSSDFTYNLTTWSNLPAAGEKAVFSSSSRLRASGSAAPYTYASIGVPSVIRLYELRVPDGKVVTGITFTTRNNFRVFAITAVQTTASYAADIAETLIAALPEAAVIQLGDAAAVSNARQFADDAIAKGASVINIGKLADVEARLSALMPRSTSIDLGAFFNKDGFISLADTLPANADTISNWGFIGNWSFNGTRFGNLLTNGSMMHHNIGYRFGSVKNSDLNMVQMNNDTAIATTGILTSSISAVLTCDPASKNVNVTVKYADGTSEVKTIGIVGWSTNQASADLMASGIRTVLRNGSSYPVPIIKEEGVNWYLYATEIPVNPDKAVSSLVFQKDTAAYLLSVTEVGFSQEMFVQKLIALINGLPSVESITTEHIKTINALRKNIDFALAHGIGAAEITNLSVFNAAEAKAERLVRTNSIVDLAALYNRDVFLSAGESDSDSANTYFDSRWAYNEDMVSALLNEGQLKYDSCNYRLGTFKSKQANAIIPTVDTTIDLDDHIYSNIRFIASAINASVTNYTVTVNYSDGTSQDVVLPLIETWGTDGYTPTADAKVVYKIKRVRASDGYVVLDAFAYCYYLQPAADKKVTSIKFPSKSAVRILAVSTIDYSTDELVAAANTALANLPAVEDAEPSHKEAIVAADVQVNEAISKGALTGEFPQYNLLQALKAKVARMDNGDTWADTPVITFTDPEGNPSDKPVANGTASVSAKAYHYASQGTNVTFIIALYADGKMQTVSLEPKPLEGGSSTVLSAVLEMPESVSDNGYVKAAIWKDTITMKPFSQVGKSPQED